MRQIGVHLGHDFIAFIQRVLETVSICVSEPILCRAFNHSDVEIGSVEAACNITGSIGAGIIDHQDVDSFGVIAHR
jgi:hypothetical protein